MLYVTGSSTTIFKALLPMLPEGERIRNNTADLSRPPHEWLLSLPVDADRYLLAAGFMSGQSPSDISRVDRMKTLAVNCLSVQTICQHVLEQNPLARICVVGSESGYSGSYDESYAEAKRAAHEFIEGFPIGSGQQLVGVAPSIIKDSGMTQRRKDLANLGNLENTHPKGRFLAAKEVARLIHFLLYQDLGYITGTVVRINGGM